MSRVLEGTPEDEQIRTRPKTSARGGNFVSPIMTGEWQAGTGLPVELNAPAKFTQARMATIVVHAVLEMRAAEEHAAKHPKGQPMPRDPYLRQAEAQKRVEQLSPPELVAVATGDLTHLGEIRRPHIVDWIDEIAEARNDLMRYLVILLSGVLRMRLKEVSQVLEKADIPRATRLLAGDYQVLMEFEGIHRMEVPRAITRDTALQHLNEKMPEPALVMRPKLSGLNKTDLRWVAAALFIACILSLFKFFYSFEIECAASLAASMT